MALHLRIENETTLPDGGPIDIRVTGRRGIDIGRDTHLDWTLPDPTRYISGKHCEVRYEKGDYILYDVSTNGTFVNGSDRRMKGPHRLQTGDRIIIGNYIVAVEVDGADLDGPALRPAAATGRPGDPWDAGVEAAPPVDRKDVMVPKDRGPMTDPLDWYVEAPQIQRQEPARSSPLDPYLSPRPEPRQTPPTNPAVWDSPSIIAPAGAAAERGPSGDPFADPAPQAYRPTPPPQTPAPPPGPGQPPQQPPQAFGAPPPNGPAFAPAPPTGPGLAPPAPGGGAPSWADPQGDGPITRPVPKPANRTPKPTPAPPTGGWQDMVTEPPSLGPVPGMPGTSPTPAAREPAVQAGPARETAAAPMAPAQVADLMARFAKGAGIPPEDMLRRDAGDLMEDLGQMMRIVVENMMALNTTRRATKALMRSSEHTQLSVHDNNPIKSLPTVEMVLKYMLGPASKAYQDGARALHGSFDDLHKHQERVFIAMQQAMKMLHEDIDPAAIDHSLEPDRGIGSLVVPRKSRLWDQFVARWQAKTMRSEDGIVGLFMIYFADCYDRLGSNDPY